LAMLCFPHRSTSCSLSRTRPHRASDAIGRGRSRRTSIHGVKRKGSTGAPTVRCLKGETRVPVRLLSLQIHGGKRDALSRSHPLKPTSLGRGMSQSEAAPYLVRSRSIANRRS
jgi:hypothetical protein